MGATLFDLGGGSQFVASERHIPSVPPFGVFTDEKNPEAAKERLRAWCAEKWSTLFELKRGETERLKTCELFYAGFHYEDPWDNRINPVTNYCSTTVESIWPILTESRPRPEPAPRRFMEADRIARVRDFATYKMDSTGFDRVMRLTTRDLLKYGWCCPMISWDAQGRSIPRYLSPFDYYPDGAPDEQGLEMFALAYPVPTRRLRALFPHCADKIQPDNIASPSYAVLVQPYLDAASALGRFQVPNFIGTMPSTIKEGAAAATTSGDYVMDTGSYMVFGYTTFLIQLFVRDYTTMPVRYNGTRIDQHETGQLRNPHSLIKHEPCCPSGWRMIPITATGVLLDHPRPVDISIGGVPVVIGRNYEQGGRFYARGELDDVIPIQRDINRSDAMIARALELQSNPPVITTKDSGLNPDKSSLEGGEILRIKMGHKVDYLQPQSLAESHFVRRAARRQEVQAVSGTPDALVGQRPVGVEAGVAIKALTEQGASRARAKGAALLEYGAQLLHKMMRADIVKSAEPIYFRGNDGSDVWMNPQDLRADDWDIRWAQGTGTAQAEQDRRDLNMQLEQMGIIDAQAVLEDLDYPGRGQILMRVGQQRMMEAAAAAQATQKNGGSGNGKAR